VESIRSFRELRVWQKGMDLAMEIYTATNKFPAEERYSLTDQVRRSSRSVPANIAEAWRKRRYPAALVSKLNDAEGEAAETQTHLEISHRCGCLNEATFRRRDQAYEEVLGMLVVMAAHPERWAIRKDTEMGGRGGAETASSSSSPRPRVSVSPCPSPAPRPRILASPRPTTP